MVTTGSAIDTDGVPSGQGGRALRGPVRACPKGRGVIRHDGAKGPTTGGASIKGPTAEAVATRGRPATQTEVFSPSLASHDSRQRMPLFALWDFGRGSPVCRGLATTASPFLRFDTGEPAGAIKGGRGALRRI